MIKFSLSATFKRAALSAFRYEIMSQCWREKIADRPNFSRIRSRLEDLLAQSVDYLDLDNIDVCLEHSQNTDDDDDYSASNDRSLVSQDDVFVCWPFMQRVVLLLTSASSADRLWRLRFSEWRLHHFRCWRRRRRCRSSADVYIHRDVRASDVLELIARRFLADLLAVDGFAGFLKSHFEINLRFILKGFCDQLNCKRAKNTIIVYLSLDATDDDYQWLMMMMQAKKV